MPADPHLPLRIQALPFPDQTRSLSPTRDIAPARARVSEEKVEPGGERRGERLEGLLSADLDLAGGFGLVELERPEAARGDGGGGGGAASEGGGGGSGGGEGVLGGGEEYGERRSGVMGFRVREGGVRGLVVGDVAEERGRVRWRGGGTTARELPRRSRLLRRGAAPPLH